jgi:hypothetical protein
MIVVGFSIGCGVCVLAEGLCANKCAVAVHDTCKWRGPRIWLIIRPRCGLVNDATAGTKLQIAQKIQKCGTSVDSNAVERVMRFVFCFGGVGPEIVDVGPLPGPTRPPVGGLGKAPAGAPSICTDFQPVL